MMGASVTPWPGTTMMDRVSLDDIPHKGNIRLFYLWNKHNFALLNSRFGMRADFSVGKSDVCQLKQRISEFTHYLFNNENLFQLKHISNDNQTKNI